MVPRQVRRNATITDVARAADVSIKTVSRVFNDEPNVRAATRERVVSAAQALDYHPNLAARSLAARRSFLVGLAYGNAGPSYVHGLQAGVSARLADERYRLIVLPFIGAEEAPRRMRMAGCAAGLDGMILVPPLGDDPAVTAELDRCGLPYVRIAPDRDDSAVPDVAMDDRAAVDLVVDHLVGHGHRRIAIVCGDPAHASTHVRRTAFRDALMRHGISGDAVIEEAGDYGFDSGLAAGHRLLARAEPPTAIFASNDDMAAGVLSAAHAAGVPVPARLSIVGFDDGAIAQAVWPCLTTIHQPMRDMAYAATDALLALIEARPTPVHIVLPHRLVVRGSSGPAAGAPARLAPARSERG